MKIAELVLKTDRLHRVDYFYRNVLELPVEEEGLGSITFRIGDSLLTFERVPETGDSPFYHFAINIPPNLFDKAKEWLAQRTPLLNSDDGDDEFQFEAMDARAFYFRDPGHNIGELIAREAVSESSASSFNAGQVLGISEIGLPVQDVPQTAQQLCDTFSLPVYIPFSEGIGAVGNAEGMLILVSEERPWIPAGTPAEIHPLRVMLRGKVSGNLTLEDGFYLLSMDD